MSNNNKYKQTQFNNSRIKLNSQIFKKDKQAKAEITSFMKH